MFMALLVSGAGWACPSNPLPENTNTARSAPIDPTAPANLEKPDLARVQVDLAIVRSAVKRAQQIDGATPPTLDALGVRLSYPDDLNYDGKSGTVTSKTYPSR